mmetsp:Transcript_82474/g.229920  ORF Transcript_82474/g.229920 Transcript_82474/m.229920 type:complete len:369 (+) Transcript_82474:1423-2529(+)
MGVAAGPATSKGSSAEAFPSTTMVGRSSGFEACSSATCRATSARREGWPTYSTTNMRTRRVVKTPGNSTNFGGATMDSVPEKMVPASPPTKVHGPDSWSAYETLNLVTFCGQSARAATTTPRMGRGDPRSIWYHISPRRMTASSFTALQPCGESKRPRWWPLPIASFPWVLDAFRDSSGTFAIISLRLMEPCCVLIPRATARANGIVSHSGPAGTPKPKRRCCSTGTSVTEKICILRISQPSAPWRSSGSHSSSNSRPLWRMQMLTGSDGTGPTSCMSMTRGTVDGKPGPTTLDLAFASMTEPLPVSKTRLGMPLTPKAIESVCWRARSTNGTACHGICEKYALKDASSLSPDTKTTSKAFPCALQRL